MKIFPARQLMMILLAVMVPLTSIASPDFWIDVRSEQEYAESHVSGAIHIPFEEIREKIATVTNDKDAQIYLYCGSGYRAGIAMNYLQSMGYTRVKNVGGLSNALKLEASTEP